jgi:histidyl-tRNA synthetase
VSLFSLLFDALMLTICSGRYDNLVGMYSGKPVPCIGISFGVERIFAIIKARIEAQADSSFLRPVSISISPPDQNLKSLSNMTIKSPTQVFVMAFGGKTFDGMLKERMAIAKLLWDAGIPAEFAWKTKAKLPAQFKLADNGGIPFAVILGEDEQKEGKVKIKEMGLPEGHAEKDGVLVAQANLVDELKKRLQTKSVGSGLAERLKSLNV